MIWEKQGTKTSYSERQGTPSIQMIHRRNSDGMYIIVKAKCGWWRVQRKGSRVQGYSDAALPHDMDTDHTSHDITQRPIHVKIKKYV